MKKILITALAVAAVAPYSLAQSSIDALSLSRTELRGTARFMGMGGAFTALGGDLSTLTQNPGGIGIYRKSEVGVTLDINASKTETLSDYKYSDSRTTVACNNFGYVGALNLGDSPLRFFNWGVSYNRLAKFDRRMSGYSASQGGSLTNYIANYTNAAGYTEDDLNFTDDFNPYRGGADWLSVLAYNSYLINPVGSSDRFQGMYHNGTTADADLDIREKGYVDEYSINFGGNFVDMLYWGVGVGITDLSYTMQSTYSEGLENATAYAGRNSGLINYADAGYYLNNYKNMSGSGWKLSLGLIFKPINELRIGAAVHSPTYWSIDHSYDANVEYSYSNPATNEIFKSDKPEQTDIATFDWRLRGPWRFMVGVAGVIGNYAIVSLDYERKAYGDMTVSNAYYDSYGYIDGYSRNEHITNDIRDYYKAADEVRFGVEVRPIRPLSIRAGYNYQTSMVKNAAAADEIEIVTSGTDPSYRFDKKTNNISFGLGYRAGAFTIDATYMYTRRNSTLHAYTPYNGMPTNQLPPAFDVKETNNNIVLSLAYHF
ncbi:MAG: hypothetical protein PUC94_06955 [Bacteroidales bacterium]|nr:hypothetical protein [Bacteroidales bacterium]